MLLNSVTLKFQSFYYVCVHVHIFCFTKIGLYLLSSIIYLFIAVEIIIFLMTIKVVKFLLRQFSTVSCF